METGTTVFHFSVQQDASRPLNYSHEYQVVFIEPNDGSHIFELQLGAHARIFTLRIGSLCSVADMRIHHLTGSPFTNPTGQVPVADAHSFKVLDHALNVLFSTPFTADVWHNFAVEVDWNARTLAVFNSQDAEPLQRVTDTVPNSSAASVPAGQGDFHFGVLKVRYSIYAQRSIGCSS